MYTHSKDKRQDGYILLTPLFCSYLMHLTESKQNKQKVVDVSGGESKVWCSKEQYCIEIWNVRSMNQGKSEVVKQEMARVSNNILGISKLKWTGMGEFHSDDHYIYYCGQESLRRNRVVHRVNKRVWNAVLGCNLKNDRMISVCFQEKPFNIIVIQVYASTTNAKEAKVEWFYGDLQDLLGLTTTKKDFLFIIGDFSMSFQTCLSLHVYHSNPSLCLNH